MSGPSVRAFRSLLLASLATVLVATPALSEAGFTDPVVLHLGAPDKTILVSDIAAKDDDIVVAWWEPGVTWKSFVRTSSNGGASFTPKLRLSDRPTADPKVDVCAGRWWAVSRRNLETDHSLLFSIVLDGGDFSGSSAEQQVLREAGNDWDLLDPDLACAGSRRLVAAWSEIYLPDIPTADTRGRVVFLPVPSGGAAAAAAGPAGVMPRSFGLGQVRPGESVAVAGTSTRGYAAWFKGDELRFRRFSIGPAPDFTVTAHPAVTFLSDPEAQGPVIAASGSMVALAYSRGPDLIVRLSTNSGLSFVDFVLIDRDPGAGEPEARTIDIVGGRIIVEILDHDQGLQLRYQRSASDGLWHGQYLPAPGERVGALAKIDGSLRLVEAWDQQHSDPERHRLKFQRET